MIGNTIQKVWKVLKNCMELLKKNGALKPLKTWRTMDKTEKCGLKAKKS